MAEELLRSALDDGFHLAQEFEAGLGDVGDDNAAIVAVTALADELEAFESVEQSGDVGFGGDHAVANGGAGQSMGLCATQDAKDVVLRGCNAPVAGAAVELAMQKVGGAHDVEEGLFFRTGEGRCLRDFGLEVGHRVNELAGALVRWGLAVSHPFHDETVKWMGHGASSLVDASTVQSQIPKSEGPGGTCDRA